MVVIDKTTKHKGTVRRFTQRETLHDKYFELIHVLVFFISLIAVVCVICLCSLLVDSKCYAAVDDSYYGINWVSSPTDATQIVDLSDSSWTLRNGSTTAWCDVSSFYSGMPNHKIYSTVAIGNVSGTFIKPNKGTTVNVSLPIKVITTGYHVSQSSALTNTSPVGVYFEMGTDVNSSSISYLSAAFSYPYGYTNNSLKYPAQLKYTPDPRNHPENYYVGAFDDEGNSLVTIEFNRDLQPQDQFIVDFIIKNWQWKSGGYCVDKQYYTDYDAWLSAYQSNSGTTHALLPVTSKGAQGTNVITSNQASVSGNTGNVPVNAVGYWLFNMDDIHNYSNTVNNTTYYFTFKAPYYTRYRNTINLSQKTFKGIQVHNDIYGWHIYYIDESNVPYDVCHDNTFINDYDSRIVRITATVSAQETVFAELNKIGVYYGSIDPHTGSGGGADSGGSIINPDGSWLENAQYYLNQLVAFVSDAVNDFSSLIRAVLGWLPNEIIGIIIGVIVLMLVAAFVKSII